MQVLMEGSKVVKVHKEKKKGGKKKGKKGEDEGEGEEGEEEVEGEEEEIEGEEEFVGEEEEGEEEVCDREEEEERKEKKRKEKSKERKTKEQEKKKKPIILRKKDDHKDNSRKEKHKLRLKAPEGSDSRKKSVSISIKHKDKSDHIKFNIPEEEEEEEGLKHHKKKKKKHLEISLKHDKLSTPTKDRSSRKDSARNDSTKHPKLQRPERSDKSPKFAFKPTASEEPAVEKILSRSIQQSSLDVPSEVLTHSMSPSKHPQKLLKPQVKFTTNGKNSILSSLKPHRKTPENGVSIKKEEISLSNRKNSKVKVLETSNYEEEENQTQEDRTPNIPPLKRGSSSLAEWDLRDSGLLTTTGLKKSFRSGLNGETDIMSSSGLTRLQKNKDSKTITGSSWDDDDWDD